ncbi:MAG: hypothetical protein M3Q57_01750 [Pseudomonadota bacterium]|nr:hypothetical protein [Pseudomonadota bacterium]
MTFAAGVAATLGFGALWHGPLGAGERFTDRPEALARATLDRFERPMNSARLERRPLTRTLVLSGPADDFQRMEMVRILREVPGVSAVRWDTASLPRKGDRP